MNVLVPLFIGFAVGYALKRAEASKEGRKYLLEIATSLSVLALIFLMGVETGKVKVDAGWMLFSSLLFAVLTALGGLAFALVLWREER